MRSVIKAGLVGLVVFQFALAVPAFAGDSFSIEGHFELDYENERNFNLEKGNPEDFQTLEAELRIEVEYKPVEWMWVVTRMRPRKKFDLHEEDKIRDREWVLNLEKAYLAFEPPGTGLEIWVGRSRFRDDREWLYDANLDGVRVFFSLAGIEFDVSATRETLWTAELLSTDKEDAVNNFHIYSEFEVTEDVVIGAWWLQQDDVSGAAERNPQFFGLHSSGEPLDGLKYWAQLVHVRGNDEGETLRGYGADLGVSYKFPASWQPYVVLTYAFGSGDRNPDDGVNHAFRQTGFQDNNGRSTSVNRYKSYGELLQPDLSNMMIFGAGVGVRPIKTLSLEVIYHRYRQHRLADSLWDTDLDMDPLGINKRLGQGVDLVFGLKEKRPGWRIKVVASWFEPGRAFAPDVTSAFFGGVEFRRLF